MAFDFFKGYTSDQPPSIYDVARRQELAKQLLGNKLAPEQMGSPIGVIANALSGAGSAYENSQAASEQQQGLTNANSALAAALQGDPTQDPSSLIQAGGNPFLPDNESSLVGDLIKRKLGIGENFYGTPQISYDEQGNPHYSIIGSLGDVKEIKPPDGAGGSFSVKNQLVDTPTAAGVPVNPYAPPSAGVPKNNAQAESDKSFGTGVGKQYADAPVALQTEQNLLQTLDQQHATVSSTVDKALGQINNGVFSTGTVGNLLAAVPGSPQYDLAQNLNTIKANVGFDTLQAMRSSSPTGGALGQISNLEEELLQAVNGSLAQGQTADQLKSNLQQVKGLLAQVNSLKHQQYQQDQTRLSNPPPNSPIVGGASPVPLAPMPSAGKTFVYNPASGQLE